MLVLTILQYDYKIGTKLDTGLKYINESRTLVAFLMQLHYSYYYNNIVSSEII